MERSWLDTVQLLGLDVMLGLILAGLVASALWRLATTLIDVLRRLVRRRPRVLPTSPHDALPSQEWGPMR
jgi:hypothetical protein